MTDNYSNAGGYGLFCGKKCVAEKQAQGIAPKRSGFKGKHDAAFQALQSQKMTAASMQQAAEGGGKKSKAPLIIGVVLVLGIVATVVIIKMKKK